MKVKKLRVVEQRRRCAERATALHAYITYITFITYITVSRLPDPIPIWFFARSLAIRLA
jgi:hypothetical protein